MTALQRRIVWGAVGLLIALASPALGDSPPLTARQLASLDLAGYPRSTRPPEFSLQTHASEVVSLGALRGRVAVLNFWATWCRECATEMPSLETLHRRFGSRGLAVIGVGVREDAAAAHRYARQHGLTFPLALDRNGAVAGRYGVIGLPTTFLVGRDGRAVALAVGVREWTSPMALEIVQTLLDDPAADAGSRRPR